MKCEDPDRETQLQMVFVYSTCVNVLYIDIENAYTFLNVLVRFQYEMQTISKLSYLNSRNCAQLAHRQKRNQHQFRAE